MGKIGLGSGQLCQGLSADVQYIAGMKTRGDGAVQGIFADQIQRGPVQGVDLVTDENIARTDQRQHQFDIIVKVQAAHVPSFVVVELKMKFHIVHSVSSTFK